MALPKLCRGIPLYCRNTFHIYPVFSDSFIYSKNNTKQSIRQFSSQLSQLDAIKELRSITGVSIGRCKQALNSSKWDVDKARKWIRENGLASANNLSSRASNEGLVGFRQNNRYSLLLQISSSTDFVAKNDIFLKVFDNLLNEIVSLENHNYDNLNIDQLDSIVLKNKVDPKFQGNTIGETISELCEIFNEPIKLKNIVFMPKLTNSFTMGYVHNEHRHNIGQAASMININVENRNDSELSAEFTRLLEFFGKQVAMQVVANRPTFINRSQVPEELVAKEVEIINASIPSTIKEIAKEKILSQKLENFYDEACLLQQEILTRNQFMSFLQSNNKVYDDIINFLNTKKSLKLNEIISSFEDAYMSKIMLSEFAYIGIKNKFINSST